MIYLYVKTHLDTGLKYLGKTIKDPFKYKGSGKYWLRHIAKHGYNCSTEIIFESTDHNEIKQIGQQYSKMWNIVNSSNWANLKEESGDGGGYIHSNETKSKVSEKLKGRSLTDDHKAKLSAAHKGHRDYRSAESKKIAGIKASRALKGKKKPEGFGEKISKIRTGTVMSETTKEKMKRAWTPERRAAQAERRRQQNQLRLLK